MQFRRVPSLPPYVFAVTEQLKLELRRAGEDVIDLGFGNPDLPSPPAAVDKLIEAAAKPRNHRYSASRGIPKLRGAICDLYLADEVFMSGTAAEVTPLRSVDDVEIGVGPVTEAIRDEYLRCVRGLSSYEPGWLEHVTLELAA